jgi:phage terminase large subunit-like protein
MTEVKAKVKKTGATKKPAKKLMGNVKPRLHTPFLKGESKIGEVLQFAEKLGIKLFDWQIVVLTDLLTIDKEGMYVKKFSGLCVSRQNGKTFLSQMLILSKMFLWGESVLGMAHKRDLALLTWKSIVNIIEANEFLMDQVKGDGKRTDGITRTNGGECITLKNGATYRIAASTEGGARGLPADFLYIDELLLVTPEGWAAARPTTTAKPNAQTFVTTNAGSAHSIVLNDLRERALSYPNETFGWYEYSAEPHIKISEKRGWQQANPSLGITITEATLAEYVATMPTDQFMREHLCQWVDAAQSPWAYGVIEATSDSSLQITAGGNIYFAMDVSPSKRDGALVAGKLNPETGKIEIGLMQLWTSEIAIDEVKMASEINVWAQKFRPKGICYDKYATASIALKLQQSGQKIIENSGQEFYQACSTLAESFIHNRLVHSGQPELVSMFNNCSAKINGDHGWRIVRRKSAGSVAGAIGTAMIVHQLSKPQSTAQIFI